VVNDVRVGGVRVPLNDALSSAEDYLTGRHGLWAYPAYDSYSGSRSESLGDADLLAPVLLNVNHLTLRAYYGLQKACDRLNQVLEQIPLSLTLDGDDAQVRDYLPHIGKLFSILDEPELPDVGGTILAKILHRKRPAFIPLYDANVLYCYRDAPQAHIPHDRNRTWAQFMVLLAQSIRADLRAQPEVWERIAAYAQKPPINRLRALDIIAWRAGRDQRSVP
jgi:hypothetical protein